MLDMIKTLANGILEQVKSFRGDWNVNDISSPHYIKNRTHYTEKKYVDVLSQKTFTGDSLKLKTPLKKGKSYLVEFNGVQYKCTAKEYDGYIFIGNNAIYEWDDGDETDTGEPFAFECEKDEPYLVVTLADTVTEPPTIRITTEEEIIHKLDKKYLPEMPSIGKSSGGKNSEIFNDYDNNATDGDYSHAEGYSTAVLANYGHTEGWTTFVDAEAAHAEGWSTYASGIGAHAEGNQSSARGDYSHAEGFETFADGKGSHSEGHYTFASGEYQHVQGRFNIDDVDNYYEPLNTYAHIVGNGTDYSERSNAHTLDWDGNAWFAGDVYVSSTSGTNMDEGSKKLITEDKLSDYYLKTEADTLHSELHDYVDTEVAALVNAAPETLDTLGELAAAFNENKEVVEALDASITNKQDKISDSLILVDTVTGTQYKIQIQNGQLVSFPV